MHIGIGGSKAKQLSQDKYEKFNKLFDKVHVNSTQWKPKEDSAISKLLSYISKESGAVIWKKDQQYIDKY